MQRRQKPNNNEPLSPDADDVEVGDSADLELEGELGHAARVGDLAAQDVALLLALYALQHSDNG